MKRSDFIKSFGLGASGLIIPAHLAKQRPVKIYDNYVRGLVYYSYTKLENTIKEGDELLLQREADNKYDSFAIAVYYDSLKLGYIAAYENIVLANMMDAEVKLHAFVNYLNTERAITQKLSIEVYAELISPMVRPVDIQAAHRADDKPDSYRN